MTVSCTSCAFYKSADHTCRRRSPQPYMATGNVVLSWPLVNEDDWCGEGYNPTDGWYNTVPIYSGTLTR